VLELPAAEAPTSFLAKPFSGADVIEQLTSLLKRRRPLR